MATTSSTTHRHSVASIEGEGGLWGGGASPHACITDLRWRLSDNMGVGGSGGSSGGASTRTGVGASTGTGTGAGTRTGTGTSRCWMMVPRQLVVGVGDREGHHLTPTPGRLGRSTGSRRRPAGPGPSPSPSPSPSPRLLRPTLALAAVGGSLAAPAIVQLNVAVLSTSNEAQAADRAHAQQAITHYSGSGVKWVG
jgi:hypothetical protein